MFPSYTCTGTEDHQADDGATRTTGRDPTAASAWGRSTSSTGRGGTCKEPGINTNFFQCCTTDGLISSSSRRCAGAETARPRRPCTQGGPTTSGHSARRWPLIGCVQTAQTHCIFESKLGRIIQEQGRMQLRAFQGRKRQPDWGTPEIPTAGDSRRRSSSPWISARWTSPSTSRTSGQGQCRHTAGNEEQCPELLLQLLP